MWIIHNLWIEPNKAPFGISRTDERGQHDKNFVAGIQCIIVLASPQMVSGIHAKIGKMDSR